MSQRLEGVSILIAEDHDHDETRDVLCLALANEGAHVECVSSAAEAIQAAESLRPDVIVADLHAGDGGLVLEIRRRLQSLVPAVCLAAPVGAEEIDRAHAAGFQTILGRPFEPDSLVLVIESLLRP